jgi:hypothetical protein
MTSIRSEIRGTAAAYAACFFFFPAALTDIRQPKKSTEAGAAIGIGKERHAEPSRYREYVLISDRIIYVSMKVCFSSLSSLSLSFPLHSLHRDPSSIYLLLTIYRIMNC